MVRRRFSFLLVGVLWILVISAACRPAVGPRLTLPETERDLGPIRANDETEFVFVFSNTGDRPLRVEGVDVLPATPGG